MNETEMSPAGITGSVPEETAGEECSVCNSESLSCDDTPGSIGAEELQRLLAEAEARGAAKARQEMANAKASPGSLCGSAGESAPVFTREEVAGMTPAQVAEHFDRIRVSMRHWN